MKQSNLASLKQQIKSVLDRLPVDIGGGCSLQKAMVLAGLIMLDRLNTTLDIGVYRGRSFFPQAVAHRNYTGGLVYGVDPYTREDAREADLPDELKPVLNEFFASFDYDGLYLEVETLRKTLRLEQFCLLVRSRSDLAAQAFKNTRANFGLVHIDGNHDTRLVVEDINNYLPLLLPGGFVVLDDASWQSVQPGRQILSDTLTLLISVKDELNDYEVYWKGSSPDSADRYRKWIRDIIDC